ncbi:MAG: SRPBCC family protein [Ktedonobacterales bacterium]
MTLIQKSVTINAPVDKVLSILEDPERQSELNPNLKLLSYRPSPLGFYDTQWEYKMAGMKFSGESTVIAYEQGKRIVYESKGGIDSHWEWTINAQGNITQVALALTYTMPGSLLGAALNKLVIEGQNEKDIEGELANLKRLSES